MRRSTCIAWAVKAFTEWISEHNSKYQVPNNFLDQISQKEVFHKIIGCPVSLSRLEDKTVKIINQLFRTAFLPVPYEGTKSGYTRLSFEEGWVVHGGTKSTFVELRQKGVVAEVKHTAVITQKEEDQLWD